MTARLQKIMSQWGIASRRQAEEMIRSGQVTVNGRLAQLGDTADPAIDRIDVAGRRLAAPPQRYYLLLNKPAGVVSTCIDPQGRSTVLDLLPPQLQQGLGIHPVGRLDIDSTGALLLTNDGELTCLLTHPRHQVSKTYIALVEGHPAPQTLEAWRTGIELEGSWTLPAQVTVLDQDQYNTRLQIILREGRNRQVRRVAEQLNHPVLRLERTAIGCIPLHLPAQSLPRGEYRTLIPTEVTWLSTTLNHVITPNL
jgi:pseudouridine synthase